jgi:hypothetical protein
MSSFALKGIFSNGWPPSMCSTETQHFVPSREYRDYPDRWRLDRCSDEPFDISALFQETDDKRSEISQTLSGGNESESLEAMEQMLYCEIARAIHGSNFIERAGLGLDETQKICCVIFRGGQRLLLDYGDR